MREDAFCATAGNPQTAAVQPASTATMASVAEEELDVSVHGVGVVGRVPDAEEVAVGGGEGHGVLRGKWIRSAAMTIGAFRSLALRPTQ